jgi:hypothetical protein
MKSLRACVLILFGVLLASLPACAREPATAPVEFTNRLIGEKSPYLLQHAHNPVDWYPWGEEAFAKSRKENKPIFLSVGYSTCHWCHVMERESFTDPKIAAYMNHHFVNIKVDREERPDVDNVYMTFVQATTGGGGWPMSVWLTPISGPSRAERISRRTTLTGVRDFSQCSSRSPKPGRRTKNKSAIRPTR